MKNEKTVTITTGSITPAFLLFITFLVLKLTKVITWSWLWITAPLWIPIALFIAIILIALIVWGIVVLVVIIKD